MWWDGVQGWRMPRRSERAVGVVSRTARLSYYAKGNALGRNVVVVTVIVVARGRRQWFQMKAMKGTEEGGVRGMAGVAARLGAWMGRSVAET